MVLDYLAHSHGANVLWVAFSSHSYGLLLPSPFMVCLKFRLCPWILLSDSSD